MATITVNLLTEALLLAAAEQRARPGSSEREALRLAKRRAAMQCLSSVSCNTPCTISTCLGCEALGLVWDLERKGWPWC